LDLFAGRGWQIFTNVIGSDWQFAVTAIYQGGELNARGAAKGANRVQGCAHGSSGKEDIVDNDDGSRLERQWKFRCVDHGQLGASPDIIAMHCDIDRPGFDVDLGNFGNEFRKPARDFHPAQWNSGEHNRLQVGILFNDFVSNSSQSSTNCFAVHDRNGVSRTGCIFVFVHLHP
jgi:hypothetical protein